MKLGIITFLHNDNYGSTLQAWALQQTVQQLGFDAEHIDYKPSQVEKVRNLLLSGNSPKLILEGLQKKAVKASNQGARRKSATFRDFYRERMRLSPVCADHAALKKQAAQYDILLCGSDQIWSPVWLNPAYFLDFAGIKPRVAYAPSLGVSQMPSQRKARRMAGLMKGFSAVSVREEEGARLLEPLLGHKPTVLPDPVCLQPKEAWEDLALKPDCTEPYLLCYFIGDDPSYWQRVKALAQQTGLAVKVIPVTDNAYHQGYDLCDGLSPQEWLGWLAGATCICTDSFHGTVFASIFQRPFHVFRRYKENDPESKNSRIDNLMRQLGLSWESSAIDWDQVSMRLHDMRQTGRDWLETSLRQATDGPTSVFIKAKK